MALCQCSKDTKEKIWVVVKNGQPATFVPPESHAAPSSICPSTHSRDHTEQPYKNEDSNKCADDDPSDRPLLCESVVSSATTLPWHTDIYENVRAQVVVVKRNKGPGPQP